MNLAPVPIRVMLTNGKTWLIETQWARWLVSLVERVNGMAMTMGLVAVESTAATVTTPVEMVVDGGLYRVSYSMNLTQAATVSSSVTATVGWTFNGQSLSQSGAAMTGNTLTTQQNGTFMIQADMSSTITYAVAYASSGATPARYAFAMTVEAFQ